MKRVIFFMVLLLFVISIYAEENMPQWLLVDSADNTESTSKSASKSRSSKTSKRSRSRSGSGFDHFGLGGNISLCVPRRDVGFGFALGGHAEFNLGRAGALQYIPTISYWFTNNTTTENDWETVDHDASLGLNLFDLAYIPPWPKRIPVRPYAGLGVAICVNYWDWTTYDPQGDEYASGSGSNRARAGFNMFLGMEIPINQHLTPMVEIRFTGGHRDVRVFRLTGGFSYCF